MVHGKTVLALVPARGGSKGLVRKNVLPFNGRPLICWTVEQARAAQTVDRVMVSTDDTEIAAAARDCGAEVPFMRPGALAQDATGSVEVIMHALEWLKSNESYVPDLIILLQATTPLRTAGDIDECVRLLCEKGTESVVSVTVSEGNPYYNLVECSDCGYVAISKKGAYTRRQEVPAVYRINGAVYGWHTGIVLREKKVLTARSRMYLMPKERSVDIDDAIDFAIAEFLVRRKGEHE